MNIVKYYKNNYFECYYFLRCKKDKNYELLRLVIVDKFLEKLLLGVIIGFNFYKYLEDYVLVKDIYYVESFNNIMNMF